MVVAVVVVEVVHSFVVQVNCTFAALVVVVEDYMVVAVVVDNNLADIADWCKFVVVEAVRRIVAVGKAVVHFDIGCLGSRHSFVVVVAVADSIDWEGRCFDWCGLGIGPVADCVDCHHDLRRKGGWDLNR